MNMLLVLITDGTGITLSRQVCKQVYKIQLGKFQPDTSHHS